MINTIFCDWIILRFLNKRTYVPVNKSNSYLNMFFVNCKQENCDLNHLYFFAQYIYFSKDFHANTRLKSHQCYIIKLDIKLMYIKDICSLYTDLQISDKNMLYSYVCELFNVKQRLSLILFSQMSPVVKSVFCILYHYQKIKDKNITRSQQTIGSPEYRSSYTDSKEFHMHLIKLLSGVHSEKGLWPIPSPT